MRVKFFLIFIFFILCNRVCAQVDSTINDRQLLEYISDSTWQILKPFGQENPLLMRSLLPVNYNNLDAGITGENGKFITGQGSTKTQQYYLGTEGRTNLKKTNFWGRFSYSSIKEDSTRFAHQTRYNNTGPYYLSSPAYISYNRKIYQLQGEMERLLLQKNLPVGLRVDYRVGNHYSTNDPRGSINDFNLNINGGLGYYINKHILISGLYRYGYGQERVEIGYKNEIYIESRLYPEYNTYIVNGYGEPAPTLNTLNARYQNALKRNGVDGVLQYFFKPKHFITIIAGLNDENQKYWKQGSGLNATDTIHNTYNLSTQKIEVLWFLEKNRNSFTFLLDYKAIDGTDKNYRYSRLNNYLYSQSLVNTKIAFTRRTGNYNIVNIMLTANKNKQSRKDGLYGNHVQYTSYNIKGSAGVNHVKENFFWGVNISPEIGFSPSKDDIFSISPASASYFSKGVINHDYLYYTAKYSGAWLNANYNFKVYKRIFGGLKGDIGYTHVSAWRNNNLSQESYPGKNRWAYALSLNFVF